MDDFLQLKRNLKKDFSSLKKVRVVVSGDTDTQFLVQALRGSGFESGLDLEVLDCGFNQVERNVFDYSSQLYQFAPEFIVIFRSTHTLLNKYNQINPAEYSSFAAEELNLIDRICTTISSKLKANIIYYNYAEVNDRVFGNYANKIESSFLFQLRKLNYELMVYASHHPLFHLCDLSSIQNMIGKQLFFHPAVYFNASMVLSLDALPLIAAENIAIIAAIHGKFKKCIILDLDNTIWGGVIGDDGIENIELGSLGVGKAFSEFQYWIRKLKERGIIIAVCSKNTESVAKEPFEKHPDMVLRLDDVAIFIANWENKVDNIRHIQKRLQVDFDSMVFIDDNPMERSFVRENFPTLCVPELPKDPTTYLEYLYSLPLFETASFSEQDTQRTGQYQAESERSSFQENFTNENDFLASLNMVSVVESFSTFNIPRIAQLTQRSNQFNLRTRRYTEADIESFRLSEDHVSLSFSLMDKFGDSGLISVVILKKECIDTLFIDTWLMSCRVLKRGMENFILNTLVSFAKNNGFHNLKGEYLPTTKNQIVKDLYGDLGFTERNGFWILDTSQYSARNTHVKKK